LVDSPQVRQLSSALFNNDKMVEVVLELDRWGGVPLTTRELARSLRINDDLVKKVLIRLVLAGLLKELPRIGGPRGPLPYAVQEGHTWSALVKLAASLR
jgi:hypothetical protein